MDKKSLDKLESIKRNLDNEKRIYKEKWRDLAQFLGISFSNWSGDNPDSETLADTRPITDTTADEAGDLMASGIQGYACGASNAWFSLGFEAEEHGKNSKLAGALKICEDKIYKQFAKSDFYTASYSSTLCNVHLGTAVLWMEEDPTRQKPTYTVLHPRDCYISENAAHEVDTLFRDFWLTQEEAMSEFGDELPNEVKKCTDPMKKFQFTNYVAPRSKFKMADQVKGQKDFISVYWLTGKTNKTVKEEEYDVKPFAVWRWSRPIFGGAWGVDSPGLKQLSNIKQVNGLVEDKTRLSELIASPYGKKTRGLKVNLVPNGFTELGPGEDFTIINPAGDLSWTENLISSLQQKIRSAYYSDYFLILSSTIEQRKTATEANGLQEEKSVIMASFFTRMGSEFLEPVIEWTFRNELIHGRLPELAEFTEEELVGKEIKVDFISQLAKTQERASRHQPNAAYMNQLITLMQVFPELKFKVDPMAYMDNVAKDYGTNEKIVVPSATAKKQYEEVVKAQIQQMQAQQQLDQLQQFGSAYKDLSQSNGDNSAIEMMRKANGNG